MPNAMHLSTLSQPLKTKWGRLLLYIGLFAPSITRATCGFNNPDDPLGVGCAESTGLQARDPRLIAGEIIQVALGLLGIITVVLIIWAGFRWLTSAGNGDQIEDAKKTITAAVIGLLIILMAYALTDFIITQLYEATQGRAYGAR